MASRGLTIFMLLSLTAGVRGGESGTQAKPLIADVIVRAVGSSPERRISGELDRHDADSVVIRSGSTLHVLKWTDLTPGSAVALKARLIDRRSATGWLELAGFAWSMGAKNQARDAAAVAVKMDAKLKDEADRIFASAPGGAFHPPPATQPSVAAAPEPAPPALAPAQTNRRIAPDKVHKYQKSTAEQDVRAIAAARRNADTVQSRLKVKFQEIQTDHFICFTDWDKREFDFLKSNLEAAYAAVSRQFEIPAKENVFVGKLPIYMFAQKSDFKRYAKEIDGFDAGDGVAGYYNDEGDGSGHMAMWKPQAGGNMRQAELQWGYVLVHEFTHAFVARYRSNQGIPRWLNEGVAEVIANSQFPRANARQWARLMASKVDNHVMELFDDDKMPSGEMYPVMMSMVQTLVAR
ncbi:MAG: hypothetical protein ACREJC_22570, partial [Tepidisphaeraceae bacterium]